MRHDKQSWRDWQPPSRQAASFRKLVRDTRAAFEVDASDTLLVLECPEHGWHFMSASRAFLRSWPEAHESMLDL